MAGPFVARAMLGAIFVGAGLNKLPYMGDVAGGAGYLGAKLQNAGVTSVLSAQGFDIAPHLASLFVAAGVIELVFGLLFIIGPSRKIRNFAALVLVAFVAAITPIMHKASKGASAQEAQMDMIMTMKNLSIVGGLLSNVFSGGRSSSTAIAADDKKLN